MNIFSLSILISFYFIFLFITMLCCCCLIGRLFFRRISFTILFLLVFFCYSSCYVLILSSSNCQLIVCVVLAQDLDSMSASAKSIFFVCCFTYLLFVSFIHFACIKLLLTYFNLLTFLVTYIYSYKNILANTLIHSNSLHFASTAISPLHSASSWACW